MFPAADREDRRAARDDNRRAVDEATTLGARCLVLVAGGLPKARDGTVVSKDLGGAREMVRDGIGELLEHAQAAGMPLAIEPLHPMYAADRACVNTLAQAMRYATSSRWTVAPAWCGRRRLSRLGDPELKAGIERAAPPIGCSPITSAIGWCRRRTS
jgi:hypothetical protein